MSTTRNTSTAAGFFFSMLFLFLAAMFGLVLSENLVWMYFFWEITSVVSFLLIGYTRTEEAVNNSFRALWMNLLGGFGFAVAIAYAAVNGGTVQLTEVVALGRGPSRWCCWPLRPLTKVGPDAVFPPGCWGRWWPRRLPARCCTAPPWSRRESTC